LKCKIFANKKGIGIDDAVPLIIFIFVAALVVVVFRINEQIKSDRLVTSVEQQKQIVEGHEILLAYLMQVDDNGGNKADFISNSYLKGNYDELKKDMNEYFRVKLAHVPIWQLEIIDPSKKKMTLQGDASDYFLKRYRVTSVSIPVQGLPDYIKIDMFFGK